MPDCVNIRVFDRPILKKEAPSHALPWLSIPIRYLGMSNRSRRPAQIQGRMSKNTNVLGGMSDSSNLSSISKTAILPKLLSSLTQTPRNKREKISSNCRAKQANTVQTEIENKRTKRHSHGSNSK